MIITIAHTKGGVGKSTLAWHLAHSFKDQNVTIIDLDFQQTLQFIAYIGEDPIEVVQPQDVAELLDAISQVKEDDICIIDVGGFDNDINRAAIAHSDKVLIPISESVTEVLGFKTFETILEEVDTRAELNVVLNNIHPLTKNFDVIKKAVAGKGIKLLNTVIRNRKVYRITLGHGLSVFNDFSPKNTVFSARKEIEGLRDELRQDR